MFLPSGTLSRLISILDTASTSLPGSKLRMTPRTAAFAMYTTPAQAPAIIMYDGSFRVAADSALATSGLLTALLRTFEKSGHLTISVWANRACVEPARADDTLSSPRFPKFFAREKLERSCCGNFAYRRGSSFRNRLGYSFNKLCFRDRYH